MAQDFAQPMPSELDKDQLRALIAQEISGTDIDGLDILVSQDGLRIVLPQGLDFSRLVLIDDHIVLIQPDGDVIVLLGAAERNFILQIEGTDLSADSLRVAAVSVPESEWQTTADVTEITLPNDITVLNIGSAGASEPVLVNDPLIGLPIHPLLPFTEYPWRMDDWLWLRSEAGTADIHIDPLDPDADATITLQETDSTVSFRIADYYVVTSVIGEDAERFVTIEVTLNGLPAGTVVSDGALTAQSDGTLTFAFSGPVSAFQALTVTLPTDFSTDSRIDAAAGILQGQIVATSILGDDVRTPLTVKLGVEADIVMIGPGVLELAETDGPVDFRPADALLPAATDIDGSEWITGVRFSMQDLPAGTLISLDGGQSFDEIGDVVDFTGSLEEYGNILLRLPTDFSTQNPPSSLTAQVSATTNEGGVIADSFDVSLSYELDVELDAPPILRSSEDSLAGDGSGVELFLGITVVPTDADGSEDETRVEIRYLDAPDGLAFNTGSYDPATGIWAGSIAQAQALTMILPGDYSGRLESVIHAISPEGQTRTAQVIEIAPRGDIDFDVSNVLRTETDSRIIIDASDVWNVSISDYDRNEPRETLENVTLVLNDVPGAVGGSAGISWLGVPDSTISYDAGTGVLVFSGTGAQYQALRLVFPRDFSTQSRSDGFAEGPISGTISAVSSEDDSGGQNIPFQLVIRQEGDVEIAVLAQDSLIEDQADPDDAGAAYPIRPSDMLAPRATDIDGSETVRQVVLVVRGLPATDETGAPLSDPITGDYLGLQIDPAAIVAFQRAGDGSITMTITLNESDVGDVVAAYDAISFTVPADFSTANRSDLVNGDTALPLSFDLTARTSEEGPTTTDPDASPRDGLAQEIYVLEIDYREDIDLDAPARIEVPEDGGALSDTGTTIRLGVDAVTADDIAAGNTGINIAIGDIDQSETDAVGNAPFTAIVTIRFARALPDGTEFWAGGVEIGGYDADSLTWTGTVAQANALVMEFAPDVNGTVETVITVTTLEGQEVASQTLRIAPTPDAEVVGDVETTETDADLTVLFADYVSFVDPDSNETVEFARITIEDLPAGTTANAGSFSPPDADGLVTFTYEYPSDAVPPRDLTMTFPADFSTESSISPPPGVLTAQVELEINPNTGEPNVRADSSFTITIHDEGDPEVADGVMTLAETDAPLVFRPSDSANGGVLPRVTDADGSESITGIDVTFHDFPDGTQYSTAASPGAGDYLPIPAGVLAGLTLAEYENLTIRLPVDYSTENPAATRPSLTVTALTDEGDATSNSDSGTLTITVTPEGDLPESDDFTLTLAENDPVNPPVLDDDATRTEPIQFKFAESLPGPLPSDADGSESITTIQITVTGLPDSGAMISVDDAVSFAPATNGTRIFTLAEYNALVIRLPDDFATIDTPISGQVEFITDEDHDHDVDTPTDGQDIVAFTINVTPEADIQITTADVTRAEDFVGPLADDPSATIPLNLDVQVTDIDGSETLQTITLTFDGLPDGGIVLSDGTAGPITLTPADNSIDLTGSPADLARLQALAITSLPPHYSGRIIITVDAQSDEGGTISEEFNLDITPVAEPEITLSASGATVSDGGDDGIADNVVVKEDSSFTLTFDAVTPDNADGSEFLTQIVLSNVPVGWAGADGAVDPALLSGDTGLIAGAEVDGTTVTITLVDGVTAITAGIDLTPLANDDRDVATLVGDEIRATVTSRDTADSIPDTDTATAFAEVDLDVDAVIDPASGGASGADVNENTQGRRVVRLNTNDIVLTDTDGSEQVTRIALTISVDTASDSFDPATEMDLYVSAEYSGFISIGAVDNGDGSITYTLTPTAGTSDPDFNAALDDLRLSFPQHFSGVASIDGILEWNETSTPVTYPGDVETDQSDNASSSLPAGSDQFSTTITVAAVAEAQLDASVFVLAADEVSDGSPQRVDGSVADGSISVSTILTLLESTEDGSNVPGATEPGSGRQIHVFVGLSGSTPDSDGSEELSTITISNIPTAWIADHVTAGVVSRDAFYDGAGTGPISDAEWDRIDSVTYDDGTGLLTINFTGDQTTFDGALRLTPSPYEDYDVNRGEDYPENTGFSAEGQFFGDDLTVELTTRDLTTNTPGTEQPDDATAGLEFDVDVDPVNNFAQIAAPAHGNEQEIDDAGGVWVVTLEPRIEDMDGSEEVTALILRNVPNSLTVYVLSDPSDPASPLVPALITELNVPGPDGEVFNYWSLEPDQLDHIEFRNIPTHFSGQVVGTIDVVTTETDGGGTRVTNLEIPLTIDPVTDGGDPSERAQTDEDTAVRLVLDGNIIDNATNSPGSPEALGDEIVLSNIVPDSFGRMPRFFAGDPSSGGTELFPEADGTLTLTLAQSGDLWVQAGQDSNETITFDVTVTYFETVDPDSVSTPVTRTGEVTVNVRGIADDADLIAQEDDPRATDGSPIADDGDVSVTFQNGPGYGIEKIYGYAGYANTAFTLSHRLSDTAIQSGNYPEDPVDPDSDPAFADADPLSGDMTEITNASDAFDGSETIYYIIDGVPDGSYLYGPGVQQLDPATGTYLVAADNLDTVEFLSNGAVSEPTFHDLTLYGIVYEDDQDVIELTADNIADNLAAIDALPGGAVTAQPFTVIVLPNDGDGIECEPVDPPQLTFTPEQAITPEDEGIVLRPTLDPDDPNYDSLADLAGVLPNGHNGSVTIAIELPPGASISSDPAGAVYLDPTSGNWVVDIAKLGISDDGLTTDGSITITPPPHQSSPAPFDPDETIGPNDPNYDNLDQINFTMTVNSVGCPPGTPQGSSFDIYIDPVPDGPIIAFTGDDVVKEDETVDLGIELDGSQMDVAGGMDGGERLYGNVTVNIDIDAALYAGGVLLTPEADGTYLVDPADVANLSVAPPADFGGDYITVSVTAQTEDVDGDLSDPVTVSKQIYVDAVADVPETIIDDSQIDPDTGVAYIDDSGATPILQIIEDIPFNTWPAFQVFSSDQDGSETVSITIDMRESYAQGLRLDGPATGGFIDNGDGTYTISESAFRNVTVFLLPEHARTPDEINTDIPDEFLLSISIQSLETDFINALEDQSDNTAEYVQDFVIRVRPDADVPGLSVNATASTLTEDDPDGIMLTLNGTTPDRHEELRFDITIPTDGAGNALGAILIDGVEVPVVDGVASVPTTGRGGPGILFVPDGVVTFVPAEDFSGDVALSVVAVSIDSTDPGAIFLDTQASAPEIVEFSITPAPDLTFNVDEDTVTLNETDAALVFAPAGGFTIAVTDADGSETATVTYTLTGVPDGTSWASGGDSGMAAGGTLTFTGTQAEFDALEITFPADFATNGTALSGSIDVTTNEGGQGSGSFTVAIDGELDVSVTLAEDPIVVTNAPGREEVAFGIDAAIVPGSNEWETLEEVVIDFSAPLPVGTTAPNGGELNDARTRLTFARNGMDAAAFAAAIAALSVSIPLDLAEDFTATIQVTTSHGTADPVPVEVQFVDAPAMSGSSVMAAPAPEPTDQPQAGESAAIQSAAFVPQSAEAETDGAPDSSDPMPDSGTQAPAGNSPTEGQDSVHYGSAGDDVIVVDGQAEYAGITEFRLLDGDDLIDLSEAGRGFAVDGGAGNDRIIGSAFGDTMTGGEGSDVFVLAGPTMVDVITDYTAPGAGADRDEIDLSALVQLTGSAELSDHVNYQAEDGALQVDGTQVATVNAEGGGLAQSVAVIFEDAAGQQQSAVV
ncbi:hypothetical protein PAF17_14585 [Paracoccus sp. Z330]|uniref:Uncharacterized protein n=1 Tax=Paracoccus onchidii TaxID=3017813 RepID=A0ABT4ZHD5_9RHOB|nr:hypothetical protein [Paracoccus onchidii]MDB6178722.1 hypothetical protein [Paracoccus onchidii]